MNTTRKKFKIFIFLTLITILIRLLKFKPLWIEKFYSNGIYQLISKCLRFFLGWIPFSIGDLLYLAFAIYIIKKIIFLFRSFNKINFKQKLNRSFLIKTISIIFCIYLVFNILWGLNYSRAGIAYQTKISLNTYSTAELLDLNKVLLNRLNASALQIDTVNRKKMDSNKELFNEAFEMYKQAKASFPFLNYTNKSIKPSFYTYIGKYFGFTGYYNPFTGEAQLKTSVPVFLKPYIITHEMAHQLGYARENEANFTGYLVCSKSSDPNFQYSAYFDLSIYALAELRIRDSAAFKTIKKQWNFQVQNDYRTYREYLVQNENPIEPLIMKFYDGYLKMNNQPNGTMTYNEVIALLIAYMKKYGPGKI